MHVENVAVGLGAASRAATLSCTWCTSDQHGFLTSDPAMRTYDRKLYEQIEEDSRELLRKLSWQVKVAGGTVAETHLRMGEVDLEIVALAKEIGASLIVMGCRGHRRIRRTIEGSSSDGVIRCAPYPVLVVRSHERAKAPERPVLLQGGGR